MSVLIAQVNINDSSDKTIAGVQTYDRESGGTFVGASGESFPLVPVAGEWFWRTDENKLYVYDGVVWGETDHGLLPGLGDDDHTQYHNDTRGDARYYTETEIGSTTASSEGASLVGTDTKNNLNSATTVEVALTDLDSKNPGKRSGSTGNPNGSVAGAVGDLYTDTSNYIHYINVTGANTGWVVI